MPDCSRGAIRYSDFDGFLRSRCLSTVSSEAKFLLEFRGASISFLDNKFKLR